MTARKSLAVWKFASCDGCQLSLLDCEDELLPLTGELDIEHFPEAGPARVEGSGKVCGNGRERRVRLERFAAGRENAGEREAPLRPLSPSRLSSNPQGE